MYTFILFLPETFFFFISSIIFIFSITYSLSSKLKFPTITLNSTYLALIGLFFTLFIFINSVVYYIDFSIFYKSQSNILISIFFIVCSIIIFLVSFSYNIKNNINVIEYIIFILISLGSLIVFLNVLNILLVFILLELQNILISILISIKKYNRYCIEASIKYFILGSFSSLIFLYGFTLIYGSTGLFCLHDISFFLHSFNFINNNLLYMITKISFLFIFVGLLFKIYSAPFHFWVSDIYEGSPTSVLIYISSIQLSFMVFLFIKFYLYLFYDFFNLKNMVLSIISILTLVFGSIGALFQRKIKKLISYSAITVNGFFLFSIVNNNLFLIEMSLIYFIVYVLTILLFFSILSNLFIRNEHIIYIYDLFNLYKYNKSIGFLLVFLFFSVSGLPPFIGFTSKLFRLKSFFIEYNLYVFLLIFIFMIVSFYYIRLIKNIYSLSDLTTHNRMCYIEKLNYISCVVIVYIQLFLFYLILNSSFLRNFVHLFLLDLVNLL